VTRMMDDDDDGDAHAESHINGRWRANGPNGGSDESL
jgi:hypothetical protein